MAASITVSGRERLLEAAGVHFAGAPFSAVGVAQILESARVQAPTLYHHYGDKEGLYVAWAETAFSTVGSRIAGALAQHGDLRARFAAFSAALLSDPGMDLLVTVREASTLAKPESGERILNAYLTFVYEPTCSLLVQAIEAGLCRPDNVGRLADVFLMGTYALSPSYGRSSPAPAEAGAWWADLFLAGVRPL